MYVAALKTVAPGHRDDADKHCSNLHNASNGADFILIGDAATQSRENFCWGGDKPTATALTTTARATIVAVTTPTQID
jgi:hypothetical protein